MPSYRLSEIERHVEGLLIGDPQITVNSISPVENITENSLTFILDAKKSKNATLSAAKAAITYKELPLSIPQIVVKNPKKALAQIIHLFFNTYEAITHHPCVKNAQIHPLSQVDPSVKIGAFTTIGAHTTIQEHTQIHSHVSIGDHVTIGKNCVIHPNVVLYNNVVIGNNVLINAGTVIGSSGFGYYPTQEGHWAAIQQVGTVIIEDDVEIGANTAIDRACMGETRIGKGTKLDNLIHIPHNTKIGRHCAIAGQVGFTGSATIEDHVMIGGQVGIESVTVGKGSIIAGKSGVTKSLPPGSIVSGFPAWDHKKELQKEAAIRKWFNQGK